MTAEEIDAARRGVRAAKRSMRSAFARDRIEAFHRRQMPQDDRFTDRARRRARRALDGDRSGRALRAGRDRRLSVVRADERGAGQGRRRAASGHGGAGAGRRAVAARARGGETCRRRRDLSRRRRAGDRRARLRHRDHCAGRQDRRSGQCLCRRRQAHRLRQGRHRHDRRALRGADPRRPDRKCRTGSPPIFWRKPNTTRARRRS